MPPNPFGNTLGYSGDSEHSAERPPQDPPAAEHLRQVPPMPLGDGTYYRPDAFYGLGTFYFNVEDQPVHPGDAACNPLDARKYTLAWRDWRKASRLGPDALAALEAKRQLLRMVRVGVADAFKPSDVCCGGKRLDECQTASAMIQEAEAFAIDVEQLPSEGQEWNTLAWLSKMCAQCSFSCQVAIWTRHGKRIGTRFSNTLPRVIDT